MQRKPHILIVDDDVVSRTVLNEALCSEPYVLSEVANGLDALELAKKDAVDLILLDIVMTPIDGVTALRKLKANDSTRQIPVIMVTALNMDEQVSACFDEGASDYIPKPFSYLVVRARVRAVLHNHATVG
jgi:CheY-like chemotaxis protein